MASQKKPKSKSKAKAGTSRASAEDRKRVFAEAFLSNGGNKRKAAVAAGFPDSAADKAGQRLAKDVLVLSIVRQRQDELAEKHQLTTDTIIAELSKIVHADLRTLVRNDGTMIPVHEWPDGIAGAISSLEVDEITVGGESIGQTKKIKLWDKNAAIDKAMKHLGMFERDNEQNKPVVAAFTTDAARAVRLAHLLAKAGKS